MYVPAGTKTDAAVTQGLPSRVRRTIQSIKEIVGNHSEHDIYVALKESNMDPNETAQKLLAQDPFHEVKRKRDRKKEFSKQLQNSISLTDSGGDHIEWNTTNTGPIEARKRPEHTVQAIKSHAQSDQNSRNRHYARTGVLGVTQEFRVVRDNRINQNSNKENRLAKTEKQPSVISNQSSTGRLTDQKNSESSGNSMSQIPSQVSYGASVSGSNQSPVCLPSLPKESKGLSVSTSSLIVEEHGLGSECYSEQLASTSSVAGVYSSSKDPIHVPTRNPRTSGIVGAIKREVGIVGARRQPAENSTSHSSVSSCSFTIPILEKDIPATTSSSANAAPMAKTDQYIQPGLPKSVLPGLSVNRPILGNQHGSRLHQPIAGHHKVPAGNMEWKPKSLSQKPASNTSSFETTTATVSSASGNLDRQQVEVNHLTEKLSQTNVVPYQQVIIPDHLKVPEADLSRLTFGSFGTVFDANKIFTSGVLGSAEHEAKDEPSPSSTDNIAVNQGEISANQVVLEDDQPGVSGSHSSSAVSSECSLPEGKEPLKVQNLDNYGNIGLVRGHNPSSYGPAERQEQDSSHLQSFPQQSYDHATNYDTSAFLRQAMDENAREQRIASSQEALNAHTNGAAPSTVAMVQQQQMAAMYPQPAGVHLPQYPNFIPYRQFLSPLYVPPMAMPGFSGSPAYPHLPPGSNYLIMPGGSSHLAPGGLKYAPAQYKPIPAASPIGYGSYTNPAGYAVTTPMAVSGTAGVDDVSRIKYKENNLYVPNPQAESSEIWIQTPRELSDLQSSPYYNLSGQVPHASYVPSHTGHASYNAPQSSHVPFANMYHPSQPAAMANTHHLVHQQLPGMGGVAAASGAQVGAYPQQQLGHLNWGSNF